MHTMSAMQDAALTVAARHPHAIVKGLPAIPHGGEIVGLLLVALVIAAIAGGVRLATRRSN